MAVFDKVTGLTERQETFCVEVVKAENGYASDAYRKAYNTAKSLPASIWSNVNQLLRKPKIAARIAELRADAVRKRLLSIDMVLDEVCCVAFVDPLSVYDANGKVLPVNEISEDARRAIASIEVFPSGRIKIKFFDKLQALERLMRFLGMFAKDNTRQRVQGLFDGIPRHVLKEIETCLAEIVRTRGNEPAPVGPRVTPADPCIPG